MITLNKCTGCYACYNICNVNAISMQQDSKGFYYPDINDDLCLRCNLCSKICPSNNELNIHNSVSELYAGWINDKEIRRKSTSGGVFSALANKVIQRNGIVFGAALDESMDVTHQAADTEAKIQALRGSKYVQSKINDTFKEVLSYLKTGKLVLFSGTACQIDGLYHYLNKGYENLLTIEVLCHGVPSPNVLVKYINELELLYKSKIKKIDFRHKRPSWTHWCVRAEFENGNIYFGDMYKDPYIRFFAENYTLRESCYDCRYTGIKRISDITIGDFWGYISELKGLRNDEKGISLILVNSEQGKKLLDEVKSFLTLERKSLQEPINGRNSPLIGSKPENINAEKFWMDYMNGYSMLSLKNKYLKKKNITIKNVIYKILKDNAYLLPEGLRIRVFKYSNSKRKLNNNY